MLGTREEEMWGAGGSEEKLGTLVPPGPPCRALSPKASLLASPKRSLYLHVPLSGPRQCLSCLQRVSLNGVGTTLWLKGPRGAVLPAPSPWPKDLWSDVPRASRVKPYPHPGGARRSLIVMYVEVGPPGPAGAGVPLKPQTSPRPQRLGRGGGVSGLDSPNPPLAFPPSTFSSHSCAHR